MEIETKRLIITFLDDDKTETGQSLFILMDFFVKKHNNQHTIFEKANFDEFESALNNKNDLVHCPSITLFESIPTEVWSFYEDEKSGLIKVVKFRTGAMDRKRSFEKIVISVMVGKKCTKVPEHLLKTNQISRADQSLQSILFPRKST
ncbi:ADI_G0000010.mRNA.1.CDS.1 [Saccharomyces cerevisiae]|nr:ADI_G0000010.mRNA.1.CDS.1 [Saccharomyces cerevisiae]CAI6465369.1 ADI_G0000010.mRNA.1.CDS.1 [Saccharomyces cerevisiae]